MLRIERSSNAGVVLSLSGDIEFADVAELQRLLSLEGSGQRIMLEMQDVTLVDRGALRFLADCKAAGVEIRHCPAYVREWIVGTDQSQ